MHYRYTYIVPAYYSCRADRIQTLASPHLVESQHHLNTAAGTFPAEQSCALDPCLQNWGMIKGNMKRGRGGGERGG